MTRGLVWLVYCVLLNPCVSIWWFNYHCDSCSFYSVSCVTNPQISTLVKLYFTFYPFFWNRHLFTSPLPPLSCQPFTYSKCFQSPVNLFTKSLSDLLARSPPLLTRLKKNAGRSPLECWECESLGSLNFPSASRARHEPSQDKESPLTCDVIRHVRAFLKYFILNLLVDNNFATCVC